MKTSCLDTLNGEEHELTPRYAYRLWDKGMEFKNSINLNDTVKTNENFFIGKQWEGVRSNGLPTPVFNVIKRASSFIVASITPANIKASLTALASTPNTTEIIEPVRVLNEELDTLTEINRIPALVGEFVRDSAVRGDGCIYTYWDADEDIGADYKGAIKSETVENTRVVFGNPNDRNVQSQPYIIIGKRAIRGQVRKRAKENGFEEWESIGATDDLAADSVKNTDDKVDLLFLMWKDEKGEVWGYEYTEKCAVREPWNMGIRMYPVTWLNWDYVADSYHGQAMITGLIPNQIFINKAWAAAMLSLLTMAYPKVIYDRNRIKKWDNRIGAAIGVVGDASTAARYMEGANFSPQIGQFLQMAKEETESVLGATSVAMGDTRPDNTSAIIALQRAAATPSERTKQNVFACIEELYRIYVEFIAEYYGKRTVDVSTPDEVMEMYRFAGREAPDFIQQEWDFDQYKKFPYYIKMDVGESSYFSEMANIQTLNNLLQMQAITPLQFFERIPEGYVTDRQGLINDAKKQMQAMEAAQGLQENPVMPGEEAKPDIPQGGGYSDLQRKINQSGTTEGIV